MNKADFPYHEGLYYVKSFFEVNGSGWVDEEGLELLMIEYRTGITDTGIPDGVFLCNIRGYESPFYIRPEFGEMECILHHDVHCKEVVLNHEDEVMMMHIHDRFGIEQWPYAYNFGSELFN